MSTTDPVILAPKHAEALDRFLMTRPETSLVRRSHSRAAHLVDAGAAVSGRTWPGDLGCLPHLPVHNCTNTEPDTVTPGGIR